MGRPRLYNTDEERLAAGRNRSAQYYERKRESICKRRRDKYAESKVDKKPGKEKESGAGRRRKPPLTAEEKKRRDREKSARYYQRHKSKGVRRRKSFNLDKGTNVDTSGSTESRESHSKEYRSNWEKRLDVQVVRLRTLLKDMSVFAFLEDATQRYLEDDTDGAFIAAQMPFKELRRDILNLEGELFNHSGAGAEAREVGGLLAKIQEVTWYLDDLHCFGLEQGKEEFIVSYAHGLLCYQKDEERLEAL